MAPSETDDPFQQTSVPETPMANGTAGASGTNTPKTPSLSGFALTEYSAKPTPPSEDWKAHIRKIVPEEFLLPNGTPDVSLPRSLQSSCEACLSRSACRGCRGSSLFFPCSLRHGVD